MLWPLKQLYQSLGGEGEDTVFFNDSPGVSSVLGW